MGMIGEFKEFIARGNVVDMAVGIIMGGAFGNIVNSLVKDVMMPPIGYVMGGVDFSSLKFSLPEIKIPVPDPADPTKMTEKVLAPVAINYGSFLNMLISFLIVAICVFVLVKAMNTIRKPRPGAPPEPPPQEKLLMEIRDLLKSHRA